MRRLVHYDGKEHDTNEKGTVIAGRMEFKGALKIQGLGVNLISEGVLHSKGCDIISNAKEGWRRVVLDGKVLIEAQLEQGLFVWRPPVTFLARDSYYPTCLLAAEGQEAQQRLCTTYCLYTKAARWTTLAKNLEILIYLIFTIVPVHILLNSQLLTCYA